MSALRYLFPLALVGGGIALAVSSAKADAKKKKIDKALDLGLDDCSVSESQIEGFAKAKGYQIYYFDVHATTQPPKAAYLNNPNARAFDATVCHFVGWSGAGTWVLDAPTQAEFDAWLNSSGPLPPPPPPANEKAYPSNPINQALFAEWWYQSGNPEVGVMGFWLEVSEPPTGLDIGYNLPIDFDDVVIVTNDGAFWFWDNGWHPASVLVYDYDTWYNATR
jgi:hypothetical protein